MKTGFLASTPHATGNFPGKGIVTGFLLCIFLMTGAQVQALDLLKPFARLFGGDKGVVVWKGPGQFVKIVDQDWDYDHRHAPENNHPAKFSPAELAVVLASVHAQDPEGGAVVPVFTQEEIRMLAEKVSEALGRSQPDQDVVFGVVGNHPRLASAGLRSTGCRVFVTDGALNMIFGDVLVPTDTFSGNTSEYSKPHRAGRRMESNGRDIRIARGSGINYWQGRGMTRQDWIQIDPGTLIASYGARQPGVTTGSAAFPTSGQPAGQGLSEENRRLREQLARARQRMAQAQQDNTGAAYGEAAGAAAMTMPDQGPGQGLSEENRRLREQLARARKNAAQARQDNTSGDNNESPTSAVANIPDQDAGQGPSQENRRLREQLARARKRMAQQQQETQPLTGAAAAHGGSSTARPGVANAGAGATADEGIVQRLTTLKALYDKKLITKAEYDAKRKEILEKF